MITFAYPWAFVVLPLPWLIWKLVPPTAERTLAVRVPFFSTLSAIQGVRPTTAATGPASSWLRAIFLIIMWALLVTALARPQWIGQPIMRTEAARNIMIAVDLSGSMDTRDMNPDRIGNSGSRLELVKSSLRDFVAARQHDRLGLIAFGSAPYVQSPFTDDHAAWLDLMAELQTGMAGQQTMLGDAIGLAIDTLRRSETRNRVLVFLTDGKDTGSRMPPVEAAKIAAFHDIRIHTIAIGRTDADNPEAADIDTLDRLAAETGGKAFVATDQTAFGRIVAELGELEPEEYETLSFSPRHDLFHVPLAVMGVSLLLAAISGLIGILPAKPRKVTDAAA